MGYASLCLDLVPLQQGAHCHAVGLSPSKKEAPIHHSLHVPGGSTAKASLSPDQPFP